MIKSSNGEKTPSVKTVNNDFKIDYYSKLEEVI